MMPEVGNQTEYASGSSNFEAHASELAATLPIMDETTVYLDSDTFEHEQERIFRGPTWNYLGLQEEVVNVGDFVTANVGAIPVVLNSAAEGLRAFVNRCAHLGALVVRERRGHCEKHVCPVHRWTYDHAGNLVDGGESNVRLEGVRIESYRGLVFGTLDSAAPPLHTYLTEGGLGQLDTLLGRSIRALSRHRYSIKANWKQYVDMLFRTNGMFGLPPLTESSVESRPHGLHTCWTTYCRQDEGGCHRSILERVVVEGGGTVPFFEEHERGMASAVVLLFPALLLVKIENHVQLRHIAPKSPHEFELSWINCAYADDSEHRIKVRQAQGELLGLRNPLSLDEVQELETMHAALRNEPECDGTTRSRAARIQDTHFWRSYYRVMVGASPDGNR